MEPPRGWTKCWFDSYIRKDSIIGVYVWEMQEGKKIKYQVLADIGVRMIVILRTDNHEDAIECQEKLVWELKL